MNKVILVGNLTRDPESSQTSSGVAYCRFSIAVNRSYSNAEGKKEVDYFNIITWRSTAESCGKFLKKGNKVAVNGSLQNRSYDDKDGVKRTVTDIVATEVEFLSSANSSMNSNNDSQEENNYPQERPTLQEADNDSGLPF